MAGDEDSNDSGDAAAETVETGRDMVVSSEFLPPILPILPLHDRPLFPRMMVPLLVFNEGIQEALVEMFNNSQRFVGLLLVRDSALPAADTPESIEDFYEVGVCARVVQASEPEDGQPLQLLLQVLTRFEIREVVGGPPLFRVSVRYRDDQAGEADDELRAYYVSIINMIKELVQHNPLFKEELSNLPGRLNIHEPGVLADFTAAVTSAPAAELQKVLETFDIHERLEQVLVLLNRELEVSRLQMQITKRIEDRMSRQQREFFLKEQLKEIKKELGIAKEGKDAEIEKFLERLEQLELSDEARERIDEEIDKLRMLEPSSPEFNVTRTYVDWLTILPWGRYTEDNFDLASAERVLEEDHYGLRDVKDRILETVSVGIIKGDLAGSIILLVGPPGVGKTSIGKSIARALGREFYRFSLGGMRDEAEIKGHRRTYIGAMPGKFIQALKTCHTANPVIMLDEIDKIGSSFHGDPASALLEVLDPEQNREFLDHYLDVRFDLSRVLFICTANQLDTIPGPLLNRMEVIRLSGYVLEEKLEILRRYLLPRQLEKHGLKAEQVRIGDATLRDLVDGWSREAGVRGLENYVKRILRKCARRIVEDSGQAVEINSDNLVEFAGPRVFTADKIYDEPRVGVIMGLAYTALGGSTLYIESTAVESEGKSGFKQTGQLGSVMVESSEIAYTFVRRLLDASGDARKFFDNHFLHLHVPAGATPKDGPSAGVTMACAMLSLVSGTPVVDNLAMTGELTLTGLVMPIGGVKEKLIAARRAKVTRVILPDDNRKDVDELEDYLAEGMDVLYVREFRDVVAIAFPTVTLPAAD